MLKDNPFSPPLPLAATGFSYIVTIVQSLNQVHHSAIYLYPDIVGI